MPKSKPSVLPPPPALELTEAEWEILRIIWKEQPCAAGTVQEAMAHTRKWAYTTVKTTLDRMVRKGLLKVSRIRNLQLFSAVMNETEAKRTEVCRTLKRAFNGALTPMMQFLIESEEMPEADLNALRKLVEEKPVASHATKGKRTTEARRLGEEVA